MSIRTQANPTRAYLTAMRRELFSLRGIAGTCSVAAMLIAIVVAVEIASGAIA